MQAASTLARVLISVDEAYMPAGNAGPGAEPVEEFMYTAVLAKAVSSAEAFAELAPMEA